MRANRFLIPSVSETELAISHVDLDAASPLNQNETHIHAECEIYVNLSGHVAFEVENRIYPVSRGSVIITRPHEYHHCIYLSNQRHEHYWITFRANSEDRFLKLFYGREKGWDNLICLEEAQLQKLCGILEALLKDSADLLSQRIGFLQILQLLGSGKVREDPQPSPHMPADVAQALRYMDAHLAEALDIGELAAECNVSVNTLERHFKHTLQTTPFQMLRRKRLFVSMEYLRNGTSVSEAASQSGFFDYSNYIQLFRKQFGMTPLEYKKRFALK